MVVALDPSFTPLVVQRPVQVNFDFESATGIPPSVEVVEWVDNSDPAVPKKIKLYHDGTEYGTF